MSEQLRESSPDYSAVLEKLASDSPDLAEKVAVIMLEKIAATKVQKMIDAGLISPKSQVQLFKRHAPVDNLNNRINAKAGYEKATRDYLPEFSSTPEKKTFINRMKDKFLTKVGADSSDVIDLEEKKKKRDEAFTQALKKSIGSTILTPFLIDEDTLDPEKPRGVAGIPAHLKK